jgi:RNA polymerase sigma-70 factor, ECF subfamily
MTPILARQRPDRTLERLYKKHAGDVYRYALVVLRNPADAEDVTQTTFMNAYRAIERGERPRTPQNWLIAIAHNVCRQRFRQSQRRPNEVELNESLAEAMEHDEDVVSAEDLRRALGHLAFNQRAALVMRELEGRSYTEIAEILGLSVSAVETLIFRARRALREQLEESITCHDAELAISRQLDGRLARRDKGALRAHLRECDDCARFARSQRAQRGAIKSLALIPLPPSLMSWFSHHSATATAASASASAGGAATIGGGLAFKAAVVGAGALVATGVGYEGAKKIDHHSRAAAAGKTVYANASSRAAAVAPVTFIPRAKATDEKPFRGASVKARASQHGKPAVTRGHGLALGHAKEVSVLPPSRARAHDLKPAKPGRPANPGSNGQHRGQTQSHKPPPKPKKKAPPAHGGGGGGGSGNGSGGGNGAGQGADHGQP